jgi:tyrosine-protein kinase Etk/Wzc
VAGQAAQTARTLRAAPARAVEEARLQRALANAQDLYTQVRQRSQETKLAEASSVSDVHILDAAVVPQQPVKNTAPRLMALGFIGSFGLALVGVILLDRVDPRVRYPEQVSEGLGLVILGAVPHLTGRESQNGNNATTTAAVIEALRGIRLNLRYAMGTDQVVITVTSPGSGDGKSFLCANLGLSFAEAGYKTLVIDGDIRRGVLHRGLGGRRRPGLVDVLMDEAMGESVIQQTQFPGLSLIASGARRRDAPEKLSSPKMSELMARLRQEYQVIICDSPPLMAGIDPYTLAALTGRVMLVLRTGVSRRELTGIKLQVFERLPVELVGAVLNDVPLGTVYQSYSYYLPGYEAADEGPGAVVTQRLL